MHADVPHPWPRVQPAAGDDPIEEYINDQIDEQIDDQTGEQIGEQLDKRNDELNDEQIDEQVLPWDTSGCQQPRRPSGPRCLRPTPVAPSCSGLYA